MRRYAAGLVAALALAASGCKAPPPPATPTPSATAGTLTGIATAGGTLYVSDGIGSADKGSWTTRLEWAAGVLKATHLGALDDDWDGRLNVELLTDPAWYRRLAGQDASAAAAVSRCDADTVRITVNPRILSAGAEYLDSLLLHEGVHAATGSPCTPGGPLWVKEGLAEWVAGEHSASSRQATKAWVEDTVTSTGVPKSLPDDAEFSGANQSAAYALASCVVAAAVEHGGTDWAMRYFQRLLAGQREPADTAKVTAWYGDYVRRLAESA